MGDLTRIDKAFTVEITDGVDTSVDVKQSVDGTEDGLIVREARTGQANMASSIPVAIASNQSSIDIEGNIAHDFSDSGNPVKTGGQAVTSNPTAVSNGDRVNAIYDTLGKQVVLRGSVPELTVDGNVQLNDTTTTTVISGATGVRHMITHITVSNASDTGALVRIKDGSTTKWAGFVTSYGGGVVIDLQVPLRGSTNTDWQTEVGTSGWSAASPDGVYVTLIGYKAV